MAKTPKLRLQCYVAPRVLMGLAVAPDTDGVGYALGALAWLLEDRGRGLAEVIPPQGWNLLRDALDEDCWELPEGTDTFSEVVQNRLEDYIRQTMPSDADVNADERREANDLLAMLDGLDDLDALAILTAVRHCERMGAIEPSDSIGWWEPSHRVRFGYVPIKKGRA